MKPELKKETIEELELYLECMLPDLKQGYKNTVVLYAEKLLQAEKDSICSDRLLRDCYAEIEYARESLADMPRLMSRILRLINKLKDEK